MGNDKNLVKVDNVNITGVEIKADKALNKLADTIKDVVGTFLEPLKIKKLANANAYREIKEAETKQKTALINADTELELEKRAIERIKHQETIRQLNIENTIVKSFEHLQGKEVSDEPVSKDWKNRFFDGVKDVSNEELQNLWARILATEITTPNTISLRTLEVLKNLSPKEAEIFEQAVKISSMDRMGIFRFPNANYNIYKYIPLMDFLQLKEAGLISETNLRKKYRKDEKINGSILNIGDQYFLFHHYDWEISFEYIPFTSVGKEIAKSLKIEFNKSYIQESVTMLSTSYLDSIEPILLKK